MEKMAGQRGTSRQFRVTFWDFMSGLPAGALIFMGTVLFSTLYSLHAVVPVFLPVVLLAVVCLLVGLLIGITRLGHGPATGLVAGLIAAGIQGYLWLSAAPGDTFNPMVIGPAGMLVSIFLCPAAGWLGARLRKAL